MKTTWEHKRRVGIFVTLGIVTVCLTIFFIGGSQVFKSQYGLKARFTQIQGLTDGSVVSLSGIKIGNISKIDFIPRQNAVEVTMSIDREFSEKITQGSLIEIRTQGALGDKYLFITPGSIENPPIAADSILPNAPNTDLLSVLSEKGERAATVFDILDDLRKITQSLLIDNRMAKIPAQTELALKQMTIVLGETTKLLQDFRGQTNLGAPSKVANVIDKLDKVLGKVERGEGSLGALINDTAIHDQLKSLLGGQNSSQSTRSILRTSIKHQEQHAQ
jgi:phospholipid/cholesterol/gamma-HCH transport system substrate-binding protein